MNAAYLNLTVEAGTDAITHIGLVDDTGTELTGGSPAYARKAVTWTADGDGIKRPDSDLVFDVASGTKVAGWRGYSASSGGTDYEGGDLPEREYSEQGTYTLYASKTSIKHAAAP